MSDIQAQTFFDTFLSGISVYYEGIPTDVWTPTLFGPKRTFRYRCVHRPPNIRDAHNHLDGIAQIVVNPLGVDGKVAWALEECDKYDLLKDFTPPEALRSTLNFSRTKSYGVAACAVFTRRIPAMAAVRLMKEFALALGPIWEGCEINPKQEELTPETPVGNGVALPFWNCKVLPELVRFDVHGMMVDCARNKGPQTEGNSSAPHTKATKDDPELAGYWIPDALLAMLTFYRDNFGLVFEKRGKRYAVPCPGATLDGWPDGEKHTMKDDDPLSGVAIVFLRNGWPKFRCCHAHCDGHCGQPKKTINDWREYWDPFRLWEFSDWQDAEMERLNHVR